MNFLKYKNNLKSTEDEIDEFRIFFKTYLIKISDRKKTLENLFFFKEKYYSLSKRKLVDLIDKEKTKIDIEAEDFLNKNFHLDLLNKFKKGAEEKNEKVKRNYDENLLISLAQITLESFYKTSEIEKKNTSFKYEFFKYIFDCLNNYGLHERIFKRDINIYGRFNIIVYYNQKQAIEKLLISMKYLKDNIITAWENKIDVVIDGLKIKHNDINRIKVTFTTLKDEEIFLFALKHCFVWNKIAKDTGNFINCCTDITDKIIRNPDLIILRKKEADNKLVQISYIHINRINELKEINNFKNKKFDLGKLIQLCEELNIAYENNSYFTVSLLGRTLIDHVPSIFNCTNFNEYANNCKASSIKKSMLNLQNSLRNISDYHIHSQAQQVETIPNNNTVNFSNDLDVLLAEIIKNVRENISK
ncbi:MAG TPA: hypothetical protein DEA97_21480 [Bacteroidales bacterium]|nr:MAG: hypothetical protein UR43_C0014G0011 [candidate division TM6 bacterium GW2011_GWF2_33_332]HBS89133.1 hypothetical protein [Bacteroidales bacterium]